MPETHKIAVTDADIEYLDGMASVVIDDNTLICSKDFCEKYKKSRNALYKRLPKQQDSYQIFAPKLKRYMRFIPLEVATELTDGLNICVKDTVMPEKFPLVKEVAHTKIYRVGETDIAVKNNEYICLDHIYDLCDTPNGLTQRFVNCPKTYFKDIHGGKNRLRAVTPDQISRAASKEQFLHKEILVDFIHELFPDLRDENTMDKVSEHQKNDSVPRREDTSLPYEFISAQKPKTLRQKVSEFKSILNDDLADSVPVGTTMVIKLSGDGQKITLNNIWTTHSWAGLSNEWKKAKLKAEMLSVRSSDYYLNPSSAYIWMKCPASAMATASNKKINFWHQLERVYGTKISTKEEFELLSEEFKETHSIPYSPNRGNMRHNVAASLIKSFVLKEPLTPEETMDFTENFGKEETVLDYVKFAVREFRDGGYEECFIEKDLDLPFIEADSKGRMDLMFRRKNKIKIIDYKSGEVKIPAFGNVQLMIYGFGCLSHLGFDKDLEEVELQIVQPGLDNYDSIRMSPAQLMRWGQEVLLPAAKKAMNPCADDFNFGEWCSGCNCKECRCRKFIEGEYDCSNG